VVRCRGAADVINAVTLARDENLVIAVRSGGHNIAGKAVCDGGLLIDLSLMRSVRVDPVSGTARVEPGATLAGFRKEAQAFALATPLGINSTRGVAGLPWGGDAQAWPPRRQSLLSRRRHRRCQTDSRQPSRAPRSLLGTAGRRRQFRRRNLLRVQAPS